MHPFSPSSHTQELTTVRVQDPRVQNEGSWNSYVDYKIFLHVSMERLEWVDIDRVES